MSKKTLFATLFCMLTLGTPVSAQCLLTYRLVGEHPHDGGAFTQGLTLAGNSLYESTGMYGDSSVRRVQLDNGEIQQLTTLPRRYFGEGLSLYNNKLYQLSWKRGRLFIYDADTLQRTGKQRYRGQGWGLTHDATQFIMSDGSAWLQFRNSDSFELTHRRKVTLRGEALKRLNELEWIEGRLFANVWQDSQIYIINPASGEVEYQLELGAIADQHEHQGVLNGIAWDAANNELLVTGKYWDRLYRLAIDLPWQAQKPCPAQ